jgi:hypothetical protein
MTPQEQVERAYKLAYSRTPDASELRSGAEFLARQTKLAGSREAALADLCHMLLNSNEFLYLN